MNRDMLVARMSEKVVGACAIVSRLSLERNTETV